MFIWISGQPATEYLDANGSSYFKECGVWHEFNRTDMHRGTECKVGIWRCFIRVIPKDFIHSTTINVGQIRRHTQVYLTKNYNW